MKLLDIRWGVKLRMINYKMVLTELEEGLGMKQYHCTCKSCDGVYCHCPCHDIRRKIDLDESLKGR